jgi:hypothetical protein
MRCPQSRPATISCRQTMAMSKPSGGVAAGIGAAGGAGERRRLNVPIINAHDQRPSAKYAGGRTVHLSGFGNRAKRPAWRVAPTCTVGPRRQRSNEQQNEEDNQDGLKHFLVSLNVSHRLIAKRKQSSVPAEQLGE